MPNSMDECIYYTRRTLGETGKATAWVYKKECPECHKAKMGKPVKDDGKVSIRADKYVCPECGYTEEKEEHEESLQVDVMYTCPFCGTKGETTTESKRKSWEGVKAYVFTCGKCSKKIGITKKMKKGKK